MSESDRIVVKIDALVLNGVADADAATVSRALRQSLQRELASRGLPVTQGQSHTLQVDHLSAPRLTPAPSHHGLGQNAGRALYRCLRTALNSQGKSDFRGKRGGLN